MYRSHDVEETGQYSCVFESRHIMYFLVNASLPQPLDVANLQMHRSHDVNDTGQHGV